MSCNAFGAIPIELLTLILTQEILELRKHVGSLVRNFQFLGALVDVIDCNVL